MIRLEDLKPGMRVRGLSDHRIAEIIQVLPLQTISKFAGSDNVILSAKVIYKLEDNGYGDRTIFPKDEEKLQEVCDTFVFGAEAELARLAWQARRIQSAHLFDPYHEVFASKIQVLPHQIEAVYGAMLGRQPLRFLLADDPGAGKTIMAGLYLREMMARDIVKRCLIVAPANLIEQWRDELQDKLRLRFEVFERDMLKVDPELRQHNHLIAKMDQLKRQEYLDQLGESAWDLVICDEAHKMSASYSGSQVNKTQRYHLAEMLSEISRHFLLMTATPHNGKEAEFQLFLRLLDIDRYEGTWRNISKKELRDMKFTLDQIISYYVRNVYQPLRDDLDPSSFWYHSRISSQAKSPDWLRSRKQEIETLLTGWRNRKLAASDIFSEEYLEKLREEKREFEPDIAEMLEDEIEALQIILPWAEVVDRYNSPPEERQFDTSDVILRRMKEQLVTLDGKPLYTERKAYTVNYGLSDQERELYQAVTDYCREEFNRAERLEGRSKSTVGFALTVLQRRLASSPEAIYQSLKSRRERLQNQLSSGQETTTPENSLFSEEELEDMAAQERENLEENVSAQASAARNLEELKKEIATLRDLEAQADIVRKSDRDSKWDKLREIWQERIPEMEKDGQPRKLIIFTEHVATLKYLVRQLGNLLGDQGAVVTIHGGIEQANRRLIQDEFRDNPEAQILVATDAAGEGINLQFAHLMVNYDLPWNPNRLEQRFGRIHRIGQEEVCHLWNIVAGETREGSVYQRLLQKLETIGNALNGKVFDILGELFEGKPLSQLLKEALRYGDDPRRQEELHRAIDDAVNDERIRELTQNVLAADIIDVAQLNADMQAAGADRLKPREIRDFLLRAFELSAQDGCHIRELGNGYYEITEVPEKIDWHAFQSCNVELPQAYKQVYFDPAISSAPSGFYAPELIDAGHPLLEATIGWVRESWQASLEYGESIPVWIDHSAEATELRELFYVEWTIQNAEPTNNLIEKSARFLEVEAGAYAHEVHASPALSYPAAEKQHEETIATALSQDELRGQSAEAYAEAYVAEHFVKPHREKVEKREVRRLETEKRQVEECLRAEISYEHRLEWKYEWQETGAENPAAYRGLRAQAKKRRQDLERRLEQRLRQYAQQMQISASAITVRRVAVIAPASLARD